MSRSHRLGSGNPCRGLCSTTPSLALTSLPICETIGAIVRIGRCRDGLRSWHDDGLWRRCGWRAADVVDAAAPLLLGGGPSVLRINCAVEGIHWSAGCRRSCGRRSRPSRWWSRRRSGRRCWKWCGWNSGSGLRESCGAAPSHRRAAELLLGWRPSGLPLCEASFAVVWQRSRCPAQQPQKKWDQEQQAQKTASRDQASEISTGSREIAATADILVRSLLDVVSLATAHVRQRTLTVSSTADAASCAVFALTNKAIAIRATCRCASTCTIPATICSAACCHSATHPSATIAAVHHDCKCRDARNPKKKLCTLAKMA